MSGAPLADTHCHLDYIAREQDPQAALARAQAHGLAFLVNPAVKPDNYDTVIALAERFEPVYAAMATHPTEVAALAADDAAWLAAIASRLTHPKVVAIGETGLDYYWDDSTKARQQACFAQMLDLGRRTDTPVIVHLRDKAGSEAAQADAARLIGQTPGVRGIMHCFAGDVAFAHQMIAQGFYIGIAGNVTFKNARTLQAVAADIPLDWLLLETDAPYLSPVPVRGQPNEPANLRHTATCVAQLRGIPYDELARRTTENARRAYGIC